MFLDLMKPKTHAEAQKNTCIKNMLKFFSCNWSPQKYSFGTFLKSSFHFKLGKE